MKARWLLIASILCFIIGWFLPIFLYQIDAQNAEGWEGILWLIVAPGVYSYLTFIFWAIAFILLIAAIIVYARGKG